jgi:hypothetical protein
MASGTEADQGVLRGEGLLEDDASRGGGEVVVDAGHDDGAEIVTVREQAQAGEVLKDTEFQQEVQPGLAPAERPDDREVILRECPQNPLLGEETLVFAGGGVRRLGLEAEELSNLGEERIGVEEGPPVVIGHEDLEELARDLCELGVLALPADVGEGVVARAKKRHEPLDELGPDCGLEEGRVLERAVDNLFDHVPIPLSPLFRLKNAGCLQLLTELRHVHPPVNLLLHIVQPIQAPVLPSHSLIAVWSNVCEDFEKKKEKIRKKYLVKAKIFNS